MKYLRLKHCCLLLLVVLLQGAVCKSHAEEIKLDFNKLDLQLRSIITNKNTPDEELLQAISHLGRATEPAEFWTKIANDTSYSIKHRRRAIVALFRRHCPGKNRDMVTELAKRLKPLHWLRDSDISYADPKDVEHYPFSEVSFSDSVFGINVLNGSTIYVKILGKMSREQFIGMLRGDRDIRNLTSDGVISEYKYVGDDYKDWLQEQPAALQSNH
jgi:hypothetical protein